MAGKDYSSAIVKDIFRMFAEGIGYVRMTKILRERNILNPQAYFNQNDPDYYKNSNYWREPFDWHATSIRAILNNRVYLGQVVFGRTKTKGFFDKTRIAVPEDEWIIVEGTHEPLVSQELWDTVHQAMKARHSAQRLCRPGRTQNAHSHEGQKQKNDLERSKRTLAKVDKRLAELTKILNKLYEDAALGKISEERYQAMVPTYEEEQRSLSETRAQLEREIFQSNEGYDNIEKFLTLIRKYTDVEELNAYILNELIEKIVVHEKVIDEDGGKS